MEIIFKAACSSCKDKILKGHSNFCQLKVKAWMDLGSFHRTCDYTFDLHGIVLSEEVELQSHHFILKLLLIEELLMRVGKVVVLMVVKENLKVD